MEKEFNLKETKTLDIAKEMNSGKYNLAYGVVETIGVKDFVPIKDIEMLVKENKRTTIYANIDSFQANQTTSSVLINSTSPVVLASLSSDKFREEDDRLVSNKIQIKSTCEVNECTINDTKFKLVSMFINGLDDFRINLLLSDSKQKPFMFTTFMSSLPDKELNYDNVKFILQAISMNAFPVITVFLEKGTLNARVNYVNTDQNMLIKVVGSSAFQMSFTTYSMSVGLSLYSFADIKVFSGLSKYDKDSAVLKLENPSSSGSERMSIEFNILNPYDAISLKEKK